jgi:hypothetical protein
MSGPYGADKRLEADAPGPAGRVAGRIDRPGVYVTDEVFLYRVVGLTGEACEEVEVEDCYRLGVVRVPGREFRARGLRLVTPASSGD